MCPTGPVLVQLPMDVADRKFLCSRIGNQEEDSIDGQSGGGPAVSLRRVEEDASGADRRYGDRGTQRQALAGGTRPDQTRKVILTKTARQRNSYDRWVGAGVKQAPTDGSDHGAGAIRATAALSLNTAGTARARSAAVTRKPASGQGDAENRPT